ncbi:class I SAM-dependent DNA methyltransferase [Arthrobacter sp. STN4]|uniref:type I restriction-modification system subunit M n=1 Tax=Arthrobacter sp. STN4 TaxID=2923276 RepID=UPI002119EC72|nr:class I SAM-dependent DNA methyltransferase [Arthrobacter sp. STN4]MCQ9162971.1 type I restriction-modification system subunit M [Arthrobacter sp. STN4]
MTLATTEPNHLTQQQLEQTLWRAANALRGPVDPGDFKAYVFPVLFFKWISDNWDFKHAEAVAEWEDDLTDEIEADYHVFDLPKGSHWVDVFETTSNVGAALRDALQGIEAANPERLAGVFGDVNWANEDRLPSTALKNLLKSFHSVTLNPDTVSGDMLGAAYEYLLREFAEASGKKAGEFFTPRHVVHLLVKILDPQPKESIADPACGSAGMLVETMNAVQLHGGDPRTMRLHGQEINLTTSAIAKMNLYLHGLDDFTIVRGDTFSNPQLLNGAELQKFDVTLANPPFSLQNWGADKWATDPYGRAVGGVPPKGNGDWAWIQHMIATMKRRTGRVGVVMPHGVLFRGGQEAKIREEILGRDLLEAVIGLPTNLFYATSIPVCILVFRATKPEERKNRVLFIDASSQVQPGKNQNTLSDKNVDAIDAAYKYGAGIDGSGLNPRLVHIDEIADNGHDLNIGRYIKGEAAAESDVKGALAAMFAAQEELLKAQTVLAAKLKAAGFDA